MLGWSSALTSLHTTKLSSISHHISTFLMPFQYTTIPLKFQTICWLDLPSIKTSATVLSKRQLCFTSIAWSPPSTSSSPTHSHSYSAVLSHCSSFLPLTTSISPVSTFCCTFVCPIRYSTISPNYSLPVRWILSTSYKFCHNLNLFHLKRWWTIEPSTSESPLTFSLKIIQIQSSFF